MFREELAQPHSVVLQCAEKLPDAKTYQYGRTCRILLPVEPCVVKPADHVMIMETPPYVTFEIHRVFCWRCDEWQYYWRPLIRPLEY